MPWSGPAKGRRDASTCGHVLSRSQQGPVPPGVRYYGYYSNVSRGKRKKVGSDDQIPSILESDGPSSEYRKNWAQLIQKIYETDPLCCPRCQGRMRIIAFIEDDEVIKKILKHLGLWDRKPRPPPKANSPPMTVDYTDSQLPTSDKWLAEGHDFSVIDPVYPETFTT